MNVLLSTQITDEIRERYMLLELDSFRKSISDEPVTAYALIEQVSMTEMMVMGQYLDLHKNLMRNYRMRNWNYVEQAIGHLKGKWNQQLDSFYSILLDRVENLRVQRLEDSWDGVIDKP